jgi:glycosyltransferase involved in cell wall biosynthesis
VYVDSGSTDNSLDLARRFGAEVVNLDMSIPFTAARARNAGFHRLRQISPDLPFVQFVDGDCELNAGWLTAAKSFLSTNEEAAAVCGRLRERNPDKSVYNWLCDREWDGPRGEIRACGGNAMMRVQALAAVGGYRDDVIAGEEPELCVRLRAAGWKIWRLDEEMMLHDAAMTHFGQWWQRTMRSGYAFALGAFLHGAPPERHFVWESRRAILWGIAMPLVFLAISLALHPRGWIVWLIYPAQFLRQVGRQSGPLRDRVRIAFFQLLGRFPEGIGQLKFWRDRIFGRKAHIIEYK